MEGVAVGHNFERDHPCQVRFNGFRGEDLNVKVYDGRQVMGVLIPYQERLWAVLAFSHLITHKPFEKSCIWTVFNKRFIL